MTAPKRVPFGIEGFYFFTINHKAVYSMVHGWRLASLIGAALVGGYALATAAGVFLGSVLPLPRSEATLTGHLLGFLVYTGAILWVFNLRQPVRAWLILLLSSALLAGVGLALRGQTP